MNEVVMLGGEKLRITEDFLDLASGRRILAVEKVTIEAELKKGEVATLNSDDRIRVRSMGEIFDNRRVMLYTEDSNDPENEHEIWMTKEEVLALASALVEAVR